MTVRTSRSSSRSAITEEAALPNETPCSRLTESALEKSPMRPGDQAASAAAIV
jgi:hypothetical protein